jgi:carbon storage regulator
MLVLSRKVGERVVIDGRVTVVVTRVVGNRVTLGIDAPSDVHVLRGELQGEPRGAAVDPAPAQGGRQELAKAPELAEVTEPGDLVARESADARPRVAPLAAMTGALWAAHAAGPAATTP